MLASQDFFFVHFIHFLFHLYFCGEFFIINTDHSVFIYTVFFCVFINEHQRLAWLGGCRKLRKNCYQFVEMAADVRFQLTPSWDFNARLCTSMRITLARASSLPARHIETTSQFEQRCSLIIFNEYPKDKWRKALRGMWNKILFIKRGWRFFCP